MSITKPNFFLIGAPKCGTTSMYNYLMQHPAIFFPKIKEPNYFSCEFSRLRRVETEDAYLEMYKSVGTTHKVIGDASVNYFFSRSAVTRILEFNPEARFLIMLRNPVDMAHSLHSQLYFTGDENIKDFYKAWRMQSARKVGRYIPLTCREPAYLQYLDICMLGRQVMRFLEIVPQDHMIFVLQDDLSADTEATVKEVFEFLELRALKNIDYHVANRNKTPRSQSISVLYNARLPKIITKNFCILKELIGQKNFPLRKTLSQWNRKNVVRNPMSEHVRKELAETFSADLRLLSGLIDRDLSAWSEL